MSKKNKVMIAIVATLIIMGIGVMTALSITDVNGVKIDGQTSQMMLITVTVSGIVGVIVGALFKSDTICYYKYLFSDRTELI